MSSLPERLSQIRERTFKAGSLIDCSVDLLTVVAALEVAIEALKYVRRVTYGTEICNSDAENNEILAGHYFNSANNARDALSKIEKLMVKE